jgi:hypothetical protein
LFPTAQGGFTLSNPSSLGEDASGELYITDIGNGNLYKIVPATSVGEERERAVTSAKDFASIAAIVEDLSRIASRFVAIR